LSDSDKLDRRGLIDKVRVDRLSLLPPYCLDGDENERTVDEYVDFYSKNLSEGILATRSYIDALQVFRNLPENDDSFGKLLDARRRFAKAFPFCDDELEGLPTSQLAAYHDYLLKTYREEARTGFLHKDLSTYLEALRAIEAG